MNKFGFSQQELDSWKDEPRFFAGQKKTGVILIHGWSGTTRQVVNFAKAINEMGYPVWVPLLRGHGTKPEDLETATAQQWIDDVAISIDQLREKSDLEKIVVGGVSMGGNLCLLASLRKKVDGIILVGTPVHLTNHFLVWAGVYLLPFFKKYLKKSYPKKVSSRETQQTTYQYYPVVSVRECLKVIRRSVLSLNSVSAPILILQTDKDYLVAKYSPWVIYNSVRSKFKKMQWLKTKHGNHVPKKDEESDLLPIVLGFVEELEQAENDF